MHLGNVLRAAFAALWRNRLRTMLTLLGITIGIGAVICTVALGAGSEAQIHEQLAAIGDNLVWVENGNRNVVQDDRAADGINFELIDVVARHAAHDTARAFDFEAEIGRSRHNIEP